jgi:hypothetical protein
LIRGKTAEVRPPSWISDRYFILLRELPQRPILSDVKPDRAIATIDRLLVQDELAARDTLSVRFLSVSIRAIRG